MKKIGKLFLGMILTATLLSSSLVYAADESIESDSLEIEKVGDDFYLTFSQDPVLYPGEIFTYDIGIGTNLDIEQSIAGYKLIYKPVNDPIGLLNNEVWTFTADDVVHPGEVFTVNVDGSVPDLSDVLSDTNYIDIEGYIILIDRDGNEVAECELQQRISNLSVIPLTVTLDLDSQTIWSGQEQNYTAVITNPADIDLENIRFTITIGLEADSWGDAFPTDVFVENINIPAGETVTLEGTFSLEGLNSFIGNSPTDSLRCEVIAGAVKSEETDGAFVNIAEGEVRIPVEYQENAEMGYAEFVDSSENVHLSVVDMDIIARNAFEYVTENYKDELEALKTDYTIYSTLNVKEIDADDIDSSIQSAFESFTKDEIGRYYDIGVNAYVMTEGQMVDGLENIIIPSLNQAVTIWVPMPEDLEKEGRIYTMLHYHSRKVEELSAATEDGGISFQTNSFSTYALAYKDPVQNGSVDSQSTANSANLGSQSINKVPQTGDTTNVVLYTVIIAVSVLAVITVLQKKVKNN